MSDSPRERGPVSGRLRRPLVLCILHFAALVAFRLFTDAGDFNNWDLVSFQNANSFASLRDLLLQNEVHLKQPFSFPVYNTGAESVLATVMHWMMAGTSLYWSNTVVLAVFDLVFLAALACLVRLVFPELAVQCVAWLLFAMSPVLLTFPAVSAFDMQAFADITIALVGCELVLRSRYATGVAMLAVSFLLISQAYPLSFFLPLFCFVWLGCRSVHLMGSGRTNRLRTDATLLATIIALFTAGVEVASGGAYLERVFAFTGGSLARASEQPLPLAFLERALMVVRAAFVPTVTWDQWMPGFAPVALLVVAAATTVVALFTRATESQPGRAGSAARMAAWAALVLFGYLPALNGQIKSQRCYFGDLFLALALAEAVGVLARSRGLTWSRVFASLAFVAVLADAFYVYAVTSVNHERVHWPVFDYDTADGLVRHDMDSAVELMRLQSLRRNTGIIVYYPRGVAENTTDPAMFHARFLRGFGQWRQRDDVLFTCSFCEIRYGCPNPGEPRSCKNRCCFENPLRTITRTPRLANHTFFLWWFSDPGVDDEPLQSRAFATLGQRFRIEDRGFPSLEKRWRCFELIPKPNRLAPPAS